MDLLRAIGQEHLAGALELHEPRALAGHRLLDHPAQAARAGVLEVHIALIGDHRPKLGLDRDLLEAHLQQLRVLKREGVIRLRLLKLAERALHRSPFEWLPRRVSLASFKRG